MEEVKQFIERVKRDILYGHDIAPPFVDVDKCIGCGLCVKVCPALVFELKEKKSSVSREEGCFACGQCWAVCPEEAVRQKDVATAPTLKPGLSPAVPADALLLLLRERRSTRLFTDEPISKEQLLQIIDAGRYAPTASNRQSVNYVVVSGDDKVSELRSLVESFMEKTFEVVQNDVMRYYALGYQNYKASAKKNAYFPLPYGPAVIITHTQSFDPMAPFNCAVALYNGSLMAHSLGLGSCFLGFVQNGASVDKGIKQWLGIPEENQSYAAMVVGHPDVTYHRLVERKSPEITWR
ncbi:MAG: nitroreductase family protein [Syntrophorhabdales bacterium]|jgi:nitroreductase/NAD-dependent dihydropyrimidine dehydrogenase PreA subunit